MGRIFLLRLNDGDHVPDCLESFAAQKRIFNAVCFLLGGVKDKGKVVVGPRDSNTIPPDPVVRILNGVHEVQGVGTIFSDENGRPRLHMHAALGRGDTTTTGCVRMGIDVWQIGEVVMLEIVGISALRKRNLETGFELLEID
jgi:predicted DNA-binding protein with PD1-like motif